MSVDLYMPKQNNAQLHTVVVAAVVGVAAAFLVMHMYERFTGDATLVGPGADEITVDPQQVKQGIEGLRDEEAATIAVVQAVSPAVVSIGIYQEQRAAFNTTGRSPFDEFFFGVPFEPQPAQSGTGQVIQVGGGTGFVIAEDGLIVTNRHVVDHESAEYRVMLADGQELVAEVLAKDPVHDIALIKVEASGLPTVGLGNSDDIVIGQTVIAIGNALAEFENTVTRGIVSGVNRRVVAGDGRGSSEVIEEAIQTDAAINSGNSGGPLINLSGEVIGVNTAVSNQGQSIGFATPINVARRAIESLEKYGRIVRPWLGVRYVIVTPQFAAQDGLGVEYGALIVSGGIGEGAVIADSPAEQAGLQEGDVILSVDGQRVDLNTPLASVLADYLPEDEVELMIYRGGQEEKISVTLGEFE